jgi:hypothetical protein
MSLCHQFTHQAALDFYEGFWNFGQKNLIGRLIQADGEVIQGEWKDNKLTGYGKLADPEGLKYQGEWLDGESHGTGLEMYFICIIYRWKDGQRYFGNF